MQYLNLKKLPDSLILWDLQKTYDALTKTKDEHALNFKMTRPIGRFCFNERVFNTTEF